MLKRKGSVETDFLSDSDSETQGTTRDGLSDQHVQLSRGASYLVLQTLGTNAITIVTFVILARLISTKEMGIWAVLQLIVSACLTFATWFPSAVTKYVAENIANGSKGKAAAVFYQALRANCLLYAPVIVGMYFGATFLAVHLLRDASYTSLFQWLAPDVFLDSGLVALGTYTLLGLRKFREIAVVGLAVGGALRQFLIILLVIVTQNLVGLVIGWLISDAVWVGLYFAMIVKVLGRPTFDFPLAKLFHFYWPLELAQIVGFAQTWFDRILLVPFVPLATLGVYTAAVTAFAVLKGVSAAVGNMMFPAFSSIQNKAAGSRNLLDSIAVATRYSNLILTPLAFGLIATAKPSLTLFVGQSYVGGYIPLAILSVAFAVTIFTTALSPALLALGETKPAGAINALSVVIGLIAAYPLLPLLGTVGASVARAITIILGGVLLVPVLSRKIGFHLDFVLTAKTLFAGCVMAGVVIAIQFVSYSKFLLPLYLLVGVLVYLVMLRIQKLVNVADLDLIQGLLGGRLSIVIKILGWILIPSNVKTGNTLASSGQ